MAGVSRRRNGNPTLVAAYSVPVASLTEVQRHFIIIIFPLCCSFRYLSLLHSTKSSHFHLSGVGNLLAAIQEEWRPDLYHFAFSEYGPVTFGATVLRAAGQSLLTSGVSSGQTTHLHHRRQALLAASSTAKKFPGHHGNVQEDPQGVYLDG